MPIQFQCPHCGLETPVDERFAGQTGPCRQCGKAVTVPFPAAAARPQPQAPLWYGVPCPRCGSRAVRAGPWPWYLGTIGAMFVSAKLCTQCGHQFDARKPEADFAKRKLRLAFIINGFGALGILVIVLLLGLLIYSTMR
jgi:transcription elongation factor Elf1